MSFVMLMRVGMRMTYLRQYTGIIQDVDVVEGDLPLWQARKAAVVWRHE